MKQNNSGNSTAHRNNAGKGDAQIGKVGNTEGVESTGGQLPFMPSANSYEGRMKRNMGGSKSGTTTVKNPILPNKPTKD